MQPGGHAEIVAVRVVSVGEVEGARVARKDCFGDENRGAGELGGVGEGAVEVGGVEGLDYGIEGGGEDGREGALEIGGEVAVIGHKGRGEKEALLRIVAQHDLHVFVELAVQEQFSGEFRSKVSIDGWAVGECPVLRKTRYGVVRVVQLLGRQVAELIERGDLLLGDKRCEAEGPLENSLVLIVARARDPSGALRDGLLERNLALQPAIGGDLMHDRPAASAFADDGNAVWVAAKEVDVLLHPLERQTLVV